MVRHCCANPIVYSMAQTPDRAVYPDHVLGAATAPVQLLVYGDYYCPRCAQAHEIVTAILAAFGDRVQLVFRHFPIDMLATSHHAAEAAEAAASQGQFWAMHGRLFRIPPALDDASLVEYAIALRLNVNQFLQEIADDRHVARIHGDRAQGQLDGVQSLPACFINQQRFEGSWDGSELIQTIQRLLEIDHLIT
jgi:protein-disulfide isomerase